MQRTLTGLLVAAALVAVLGAPAAPAQTFVNPANGHTYFLTPTAMPYLQARAYAASQGAYLVTINDAAEQAWLVSTFGAGTEYWIGLTDEVQEGTFQWDSGEPFTYTHWCAGEPNNGSGIEDYVGLNFCGNGGWNDYAGYNNFRGIVEVAVFPAVTAPALAVIGSPLIYQLVGMSAGSPYVFDVSVTGTSPGFTLMPGSVHIPLNPPYLNIDYGTAFPGLFVNFVGIANAAGAATTIISIPADPSLVGYQIAGAFIILDPTTVSGVGGVSNAATTAILGFPPVAGSLAPTHGPAAGGTQVMITGTNFQPGATLQFGTVAAVVGAVTPTSITCTAPAHAVGAVDIRVQNPDGLASTLPTAFTYNPTLTLAQIAPLSAPVGATITITGAGFQSGATVAVGGISAQVLTVNATTLTFVRPAGIACSTTAVVAIPDGQSASLPFNLSPFVTAVSNGNGPVAGGGLFNIFGGNFFAGTTVTVGGAPATINGLSPQLYLLCTAPPGVIGVAPVVITSPGGCTATTTYTYH